MKKCCRCQIEPGVHYASRTTAHENAAESNRNKWVKWFTFGRECRHAEAVSKQIGLFPETQLGAIQERWDRLAERMFEAYTRRWTDAQRTVFRERLWPTPPPVVPAALFADERNP